MKQKDLVSAYNAAKKLNEQTLKSGKTAKKIFDLTHGLQRFYDFQIQEQMKLMDEHPNYDPEIQGMKFPEGATEEEKKAIVDEMNEFANRLQAISELESEFDFEPFTIKLDDENISISGKDIGALMPFITFE